MRFTKSHEWIDMKGGVGTCGITDFAQKELGEIVYIELPQIGKVYKAGEAVAVLESTKSAADIYAPVSGKIVSLNGELLKMPSTLNKAAETDGWLYKMEVSDPKELELLLTKDEYQKILS